MIRHKNIYFGNDSVLKLNPLAGKIDKVDTIDDFLAVAYAVFLDAMDNDLLTHYEQPPYIYVVKFNPKTFSGRVYVLHRLLNTIPTLRKIPSLKSFVEYITRLIMNRNIETAYNLLLKYAQNTGTLDILNAVERAMSNVKSRPKRYLKIKM